MIDLKTSRKTIVGMIHVEALPGTPLHSKPVCQIIESAIMQAKVYLSCGIDSIMIENMHDLPYLNRIVGPEITASMAVIASELRKITDMPLGIQILAGANNAALAVAVAASFDYIRAEGFVFGHIGDEGYFDSCAGELLRYRKNIGADRVAIFTDVKKKHSSHAITSDVSLADTIRAAEFFLSDGIVITGDSTGMEADLNDVSMAYKSTKLPVIVGSGINLENIHNYWNYADAFIVGSYFKYSGDWRNEVDKERVALLLERVEELRNR